MSDLQNGVVRPGYCLCTPPYDSEWERDFQWCLEKHIPDWFTLRNQVQLGRYRVDYVFTDTRDGRMWVIEYDGRQFHNRRQDRERDAVIFRQFPLVQAIARVDASTGRHWKDETRCALAKHLPECFNWGCDWIAEQWQRERDRFEDWGISYLLTQVRFDEREDIDCWMDEGQLMKGAPLVPLEILIQKR